MPRFRYEAITNTGSTVSNIEEAGSKAELVTKLKTRGYWPTQIAEDGADEGSQTQNFTLFRGKIRSQEVEFFTYQMATLVNAHVPLVRSLEITSEQIDRPRLRKIVDQVRYDVEHGSTFAAALGQHPKIFSDLYVNMVKAGETGGVLGVVLERLAEFSESQRNLRNEVSSALLYPAILLSLSIIAIFVLMIIVIPKFTVMFEDMGTALPGPTQFLISTADFFAFYWWVILIVIIGSVFGIRQSIKTEKGRLIFDRVKIRSPFVGKVFSTFAIVRFTRTLATLLENGVTLVPALRVVKETIGNKVYSDAVHTAEMEIERGSTLARELKRDGSFPSLIVHMIAVGEESGDPEQMLSKLSDYFDLEIKKDLQRLTGSIGPLVILLMGLIIGFIAVAMILPIFEASTMIGGG